MRRWKWFAEELRPFRFSVRGHNKRRYQTQNRSRSALGRCSLQLVMESLEDRFLLAAHVAVLGAEPNTPWIADVNQKLTASGLFGGVDSINVNTSTPTLATLMAYDAVLVFSDYPFQDPTTLGNNLASFVDAGKGVVETTFGFDAGSLSLGGRWSTGNYNTLTIAGQSQNTPLSLGSVAEPNHPIMAGVSTFSGGTSSYHNTGSPTSGTSVIARWSDGEPLVLENAGHSGEVIGLNFFPPSNAVRSDFWVATTDGGKLLSNSVNYAAPPQQPTTLSLTAAPSTVSYGTAVSLTAHIQAGSTHPSEGTVTFVDGSTALGSQAVSSGAATLTNVVLPAGNNTITASYSDSLGNYTSSSTSTVVVVSKATPTITWATPANVTFGTALTATQLDATSSWTVAGIPGAVAGTFAYSPPLGTVPSAGDNTLNVLFTPIDTTDYTSATASVTLHVNPAPLTITANNASRLYGAGDPSFTASDNGFVNGDTTSIVSGNPTLTSTDTPTSPAGNYTITAAQGTLSAGSNYTLAFVNGTLTILQAPVGVNVTGTEGAAFANQIVATFTDPAGAAALPNYSASIDWGRRHDRDDRRDYRQRHGFHRQRRPYVCRGRHLPHHGVDQLCRLVPGHVE